jgi:hypothetical protein
MTAKHSDILLSQDHTRQLVDFILDKVPAEDRLPITEAIRGISLNAIDTYLSAPTGSLGQFFADIGLCGDFTNG